MLLFGNTLLKHSHHFDYWNQPLNMRMCICYLGSHEAGLCCYLVMHIQNLQLFYFHLWPIYWLSLVHKRLVYICTLGRAIAEAVSHWLPTVANRVRARVWQVGFVVDKVASEQVFSEYFGFLCQNHSFHQLLHHHHIHPEQLAEASRRADHPSKESCRLP
jgi:hypothetical protein